MATTGISSVVAEVKADEGFSEESMATRRPETREPRVVKANISGLNYTEAVDGDDAEANCCSKCCSCVCRSLSRVVGIVLIVVSVILMIFGICGMISSIYVLAEVDNDTVPKWSAGVVLAFSIILMLVNLGGCLAFCYAQQKAVKRLDGILNDEDEGASKWRCSLVVWILFMFVFGMVHLILGIAAAAYAGDIDVSELDNRLANATSSAQRAVANKASCEVEQRLFNTYGHSPPSALKYTNEDWKKVQKTFKCCGWTKFDTRTWSGEYCPDGGYQVYTHATNPTSSHVVDGLCESPNTGWYEHCQPLLESNSGGGELKDIPGLVWDSSIHDNDKLTCSTRFSQYVKGSAAYLILLALIEWGCVVLACLLRCWSLSAGLSEDAEDEMRLYFNSMDKDGSGTIDPKETTKYWGKDKPALSSSSSAVSWGDYLKYWKMLNKKQGWTNARIIDFHRKMRNKKAKGKLHGIDFDGDGKIDAVAQDIDGDGKIDAYLVDHDGDGIIDETIKAGTARAAEFAASRQ